MRSDVFDEYCRTMIEKGFVKEASEPKNVMTQDDLTEETKIKDKEYKDTIQALYGLDIKTNDSDKSILEQAHPGMLIIAPSDDRVNGLVEDLQERHNIMVGIVNKMPNGFLNHHRIAEQNLLKELVRLGFALDNAGEEKLCKQADECSIILTNKISKQATGKQVNEGLKKEALLPAILLNPWVLGGIASGLAAVSVYAGYKNTFGENITEGILPDTKKAISELSDVQAKVRGTDRQKVNYWLKNLEYLMSIMPEALRIVESDSSIPSIRNINDAMNAKEHIELSKSEIEKLQKYNDYFKRLADGLIGFSESVAKMVGGSGDEPTNEIWKTLSGVWEGVVGSDFSEARRAIVTLVRSLNKQIGDFESLMTDGAAKAKEKEGQIHDNLIKLVDNEKSQVAPKPESTENLSRSDYNSESNLNALTDLVFR